MSRIFSKFIPSPLHIKRASFVIFSIWFFTAGVYEIPFLNIELELVVFLKRSLLLSSVFLMSFTINWRDPIVRKLLIFWIGWVLICVSNFLFHQGIVLFHQGIEIENGFEIIVLTRIFQSASIFIIICFLLQNFRYFIEFIRHFWVVFLLISLTCFAFMVSMGFSDTLEISFMSGFGGNRTNFSIWVSQIIFLILALWYFDHVPSIERLGKFRLDIILYVFPLFTLQILSGGRLGILISLFSIIFTLFMKSTNKKQLVMQVLSVLFFVALCAYLFKEMISTPSDSFNIFRDLGDFRKFSYAAGGLDWVAVINFIDHLLSQRVYLFIQGLKELDLETLLIGKGFNNFLVQSRSFVDEQVHNVFLNVLGQVGIVGLILFTFIVSYPLFSLREDEHLVLLRYGLLVWFFPTLLQPEFFYSNISTSIAFWVVFTFALAKIYKCPIKNSAPI